MPEFQMRTEGVVGRTWHSLDAFTQGYVEALFFTEEEPGSTREQRVAADGNVRPEWADGEREGHHKDMPGDYGFGDIAPETLDRIIADCKRFQEAHATVLQEAYERDDYSDEQAGRDFWFTRNGHGVGFWDRDQLKGHVDLGESLTVASKSYSSVDAYIGDDGKVYLS